MPSRVVHLRRPPMSGFDGHASRFQPDGRNTRERGNCDNNIRLRRQALRTTNLPGSKDVHGKNGFQYPIGESNDEHTRFERHRDARCASRPDSPYKFERGFPAAGTAENAYDAADLRRAIEAYKFFYGTVATEAVMQQGLAAGAKVNEVGIVMATSPRQQFGGANADTPYAITTVDLKAAGPMVVELPPGPVHRLRGRPQYALGAGHGHDRAGEGTGRQTPDSPAGLHGHCARGLLRGPKQDLEGGGVRSDHARRWRRRQGDPGGQRHQGVSAGQGRPAGHASFH